MWNDVFSIQNNMYLCHNKAFLQKAKQVRFYYLTKSPKGKELQNPCSWALLFL